MGWPTPGPVRIKLDDGRGGAHATNFDVPATARVMPRCTITYSPLPARSTIVIQINATPPIEVPPALVTISRTGIRQQRVQKRVTPGEPPIRAEALPAGLYDVQLVTAFYGGPHYCLSLEDGGDPAAIVELADGATEHVEFDIRIGGRVRIRLDGPRRVVSASKWQLQSVHSGDEPQRIGAHAWASDGKSVVHGSIASGEWWTLDPVFEAGAHDFELLRDGEVFETRRIQVEPGRTVDWEVRVSD